MVSEYHSNRCWNIRFDSMRQDKTRCDVRRALHQRRSVVQVGREGSDETRLGTIRYDTLIFRNPIWHRAEYSLCSTVLYCLVYDNLVYIQGVNGLCDCDTHTSRPVGVRVSVSGVNAIQLNCWIQYYMSDGIWWWWDGMGWMLGDARRCFCFIKTQISALFYSTLLQLYCTMLCI